MKTPVIVTLFLILLNFLLLIPTHADEHGRFSLIHRGLAGSPKAKIGEACARPYNCASYSDLNQNIYCEKQAFGEKRCCKYWLCKSDMCSKNDDCYS